MLKYSYDKEILLKEFEKIKNMPGNFNSTYTANKIILTYQPHFYKKEHELFIYNPIIRRKLIENRIKYLNKKEHELTDKELLRGFKISGIYYGYSHFNPFIIKAFIEKYNIKSIYDPCGGWGTRLLGAYNIKYIYNDINKETYEGVKKIIKDFNLKNKYIYNNDAGKFFPKEKYESVFTCPPYYNQEDYGFNFINYKVFLEWWETVIFLNKNVKLFAFVINNKYKKDMNTICLKYFKFKDKIFIKTNKSHFNKEKGEWLLVYEKN
jgi:hypothetical protein